MALRVGDIGKIFRLATGFDMSGFTALQITFTKTDGTLLTVTDPEVTAPASPVTDPDLGSLNASEYMQYTTVSGDIDQAGSWTACGVYTDGTPKVFSSSTAAFTVLEGCP
jgi:hypothetical protein